MKKDSPGSVAYLQFLRLQRAANDTSGWTPLFDQLEYRLTDEGCGEWLLELRDILINTGDEHFLAVTICSLDGLHFACATIERSSPALNGRLLALGIWSWRSPTTLASSSLAAWFLFFIAYHDAQAEYLNEA